MAWGIARSYVRAASTPGEEIEQFICSSNSLDDPTGGLPSPFGALWPAATWSSGASGAPRAEGPHRGLPEDTAPRCSAACLRLSRTIVRDLPCIVRPAHSLPHVRRRTWEMPKPAPWALLVLVFSLAWLWGADGRPQKQPAGESVGVLKMRHCGTACRRAGGARDLLPALVAICQFLIFTRLSGYLSAWLNSQLCRPTCCQVTSRPPAGRRPACYPRARCPAHRLAVCPHHHPACTPLLNLSFFLAVPRPTLLKEGRPVRLPASRPSLGSTAAKQVPCSDRVPWCAKWKSSGRCGIKWGLEGKPIGSWWCPTTCQTCGKGLAPLNFEGEWGHASGFGGRG